MIPSNFDERPPCAGRYDLFDSTHQADHRRARELCGVCPVIDACRGLLLEARREQTIAGYGPEGTWAGVLIKPKVAGR